MGRKYLRHARRWVVERSQSWSTRFRKLLVQSEKSTASYEGLLEVACALITSQQAIAIYGSAFRLEFWRVWRWFKFVPLSPMRCGKLSE